jgi:regulator of protease activity HflC (stomatin/prohibitin superfamily)
MTVRENTRALVLKNGQFDRILTPGRHKLPAWRNEYNLTNFDLVQPIFVSDFAKTIFKEREDIARAHLTEVITSPSEVAVLYRDAKLFGIQNPDSRSVLWTDAGPWTTEHIDVSEDLQVAPALLQRTASVRTIDNITRTTVDSGQVGLLYVDNVLMRQLTPGSYGFWKAGRSVAVRVVDIREQSMDVAGQEVLTKDKVTIRINVAARYRVTDPVKAVSEAKDFGDSFYRALQFAFRKTLGAKTLDDTLANKVVVDDQAAKAVRSEMADIGLTVGEIAIKDVILPGDMRDILNTVVLAEKEAQANVVRRREETAATRALLNTSRLMDENPSMMRLKELDALEAIADKVGSLTVHNGTRGLLDDLVSLKPSDPKPTRRKSAK